MRNTYVEDKQKMSYKKVYRNSSFLTKIVQKKIMAEFKFYELYKNCGIYEVRPICVI